MKRRGERDIPDFSSKRKPPAGGGTPQPKPATQSPVPRDRVSKPQATSSKSGRRGQ